LDDSRKVGEWGDKRNRYAIVMWVSECMTSASYVFRSRAAKSEQQKKEKSNWFLLVMLLAWFVVSV
jgi:hypothetical protein